MERITLEIDNPRDADLLISLAKRIGITIVDEKRIIAASDLKHSRSVIEKGCNISSYGDPVKWRRRVRKDRNMPRGFAE
jgi:hypothetical protein